MIFRDAGCVALGLGGITYQIATWKISEALLIACTTLLGIPAAVGLLSLRGNGNGGGGTTGLSSQSLAVSPPPHSPSPSPTAPTGGEP